MTTQILWNVYHHLYLDSLSAQLLEGHVNKLLGSATSFDDWVNGEFGKGFRFTDQGTFYTVRGVWSRYANALGSRDIVRCRSELEAALKATRDHSNKFAGREDIVFKGARSAAPLGMYSLADDQLKVSLEKWWRTGTTRDVPEGTNIPNPLFSATMSENIVLSYKCDPLLIYHLGTAKAHLSESSPLKLSATQGQGTASDIVAAAYLQFTAWAEAFAQSARGDWVLEFSAADGLALCQTLQHHRATGQLCAGFYRRQFSPARLALDKAYDGPGAPTSSHFNVVDTSDL